MGPAMDDVVAAPVQPTTPAADVATAAAAPAVTTASNANTNTTTSAPAATPVRPAAATTTNTAPATPPHAINFPLRPVTATSAHTAQPAGHAAAADAGSIGGAVFSLLLVIGLILGLGWLARRMPGMRGGSQSSQLKVVASVALGPRDRAVVLDVGGQQLLVGVGQGGVRTLHTLEHPLPVVESTAPSAFAHVLAQHFGRKS
jgi:flagellar protein FliO/FliZ